MAGVYLWHHLAAAGNRSVLYSWPWVGWKVSRHGSPVDAAATETLLQSTGYLPFSETHTHTNKHGVDTGIKPFLTLLEALQNLTH